MTEAVDNKTIEEIYWVGGEPLVWDFHWKTMQRLKDNHTIRQVYCRYNTNLSLIERNGINLFEDILPFTKDYLICCRVDYTESVGVGMAYDITPTNYKNLKSLNSQKLEEIINADSFKQARLDMLNGRKPKACTDCYRNENLKIKSKRQIENAAYPFNLSTILEKTNADGSIKADFQFVELRMGNLCNLKCRTCNPHSSTKWIADYVELTKNTNFL